MAKLIYSAIADLTVAGPELAGERRFGNGVVYLHSRTRS
jgi:hypothetical protein